MKAILVNQRYRVDRKIGQGGFGLVYQGFDVEQEREVAMKLMHVRDDTDILKAEADTYATLSGGFGIPQVFWSGYECDYYVLVHELLGPSLEDLLNYCGRQFSLKTTLLLADQAISRIEYIHDRGILHRDVKPDNFLLGVGRRGNVLYTIDFGLAEQFRDGKGGTAIAGHGMIGTSRYASLNVHNGHAYSRRDDLESLGYVLLYCASGSLPWQGFKAATEKERLDMVKECKSSTSVEALCCGLPEQFAAYMRHVRSLDTGTRPDYALLRKLFRRLFSARGFRHDNVFDWTQKLFDECQQRQEPT